jgi:hypothetical protein
MKISFDNMFLFVGVRSKGIYSYDISTLDKAKSMNLYQRIYSTGLALFINFFYQNSKYLVLCDGTELKIY